MIDIRNFKGFDFQFKEIAMISNLVNDDYVEHYSYDKGNWLIRDKNLFQDRLLLYLDNCIIGFISYEQGKDENKRTIFFDLKINPIHNGKGYRKILYQKMIKNIKPIRCNKLLTEVYEHEHYKNYQKLLITNKFQLVQRNRQYSCDTKKIDFNGYDELNKKLELDGIQLCESKKELIDKIDHYQKLEYLEWAVDQDIPIPDGIKRTRNSFERFLKEKLFFEQECYGTEIIAIKDFEYIGLTNLSVYYRSEPFKAWTETTGVLKKFRRRGIATALKIRAIQKLISKGITEIRTDNEFNNPMYKINEKLGFYSVPDSLEYLKILDV